MKQVSVDRELEALESFVKKDSTESVYVLRVIDKKILTLRSKMLASLRNHEDRKAGEYRATMEELAGIPQLINDRIKEIRGN